MDQERFSDLATISIEKEVIKKSTDFAQEKVQTINFI